MMKCVAIVGLLAVASAAQAGFNTYYSRGDYNGFAANAGETLSFVGGPNNLWTKTYTIGGGSPTATTLPASTRYGGKVATSDYSIEAPAFENVRFETPASGEFTYNFFDQTSWSDGWSPSSGRRLGYTGTTYGWEVMGSWSGFSSPTATTLVGGVYEGQLALAAGSYEFKFRKAGDWDINVGGNGLAHNSGNGSFLADVAGTYTFRLDLSNGRWQVVPAPGAMALLGLGGLVAARRRRN